MTDTPPLSPRPASCAACGALLARFASDARRDRGSIYCNDCGSTLRRRLRSRRAGRDALRAQARGDQPEGERILAAARAANENEWSAE